MKVTIISIPVRDQEQALQFYTEKLGFLKKKDEPVGGGNRWLTLGFERGPGRTGSIAGTGSTSF